MEKNVTTRRFRKVALVEAVQTFDQTGTDGVIKFKDNPPWLVEALMAGKIYRSGREKSYKIETLEGTVELKPGHWIARGVNGEIWPIDPDVFSKTYEEVYDY